MKTNKRYNLENKKNRVYVERKLVMILKICELDSDNTWLYDGLECIKRSNKEKDTLHTFPIIAGKPPIADIIGVNLESSTNEILYYRLYCRSKLGKEFFILFKGTAYICGDDNKTLEIVRWD